MHVVMRSIFNLRSLRTAGRRSVTAVIDGSVGTDGAEYLRLLRPWRSWLSIENVLTVSSPPAPDSLKNVVSSACQAIVVVSERADIVESVRQECQRLNVVCVDSLPPGSDDRTLWLSQEVEFHDFEIGGINERDGQSPQFSPHILRLLSYTHCGTIFPKYILPYLDRFAPGDRRSPVEVLDVGCGPISALRWGVLNGALMVTGVDPLLDMYAIILERHGLSGLPAIRCQREIGIDAEELAAAVPRNAYDVAFSRNALDHVTDPPLLVRQVAGCLRPQGIFALEFNTREGTREQWAALHKFDLYVDSHKRLICESRDGARRLLVPEETGLVLHEVVMSDDAYTVVVLERQSTGGDVERRGEFGKIWRRLSAGPGLLNRGSRAKRAYTQLKRVVKSFVR